MGTGHRIAPRAQGLGVTGGRGPAPLPSLGKLRLRHQGEEGADQRLGPLSESGVAWRKAAETRGLRWFCSLFFVASFTLSRPLEWALHSLPGTGQEVGFVGTQLSP